MAGLVKPIVVVGSSNMDLVARAQRIPGIGETLMGQTFHTVPGGKGANQAVAAAKLGAQVYFLTCLGSDPFAAELIANFNEVGLKMDYVRQVDEMTTGVALITVDAQGQNAIVVVPGANRSLTAHDVRLAEKIIAQAGAVVAQLEVPMAAVEEAASLAAVHHVPFILDPAPARPLSDALLKQVTLIKPNETEAELLTGIQVHNDASAIQAAQALQKKGVANVLITLGQAGFLLLTRQETHRVPCLPVTSCDTTAAGDAFAGALAWRITQGSSWLEAAQYANGAAALSVTRPGAQPSLPTAPELAAFFSESNR